MTFPEFDKFFDEFIDECRKMRDTKGKEYARDASRFANFDRLAERKKLPRLTIADVYLTKHLDAIESYLQTGTIHSTERIRGRFVDAVTYLILMAGMAAESDINDPSTVSKTTKDSPGFQTSKNRIVDVHQPILTRKCKCGHTLKEHIATGTDNQSCYYCDSCTNFEFQHPIKKIIKCCELDDDGDGNCRIHSAPGVLK